MSKPTIYSFCQAGCKWETVHKSDFDESMGRYVRVDGWNDWPVPYEMGVDNLRPLREVGEYDIHIQITKVGGATDHFWCGKTFRFNGYFFNEYIEGGDLESNTIHSLFKTCVLPLSSDFVDTQGIVEDFKLGSDYLVLDIRQESFAADVHLYKVNKDTTLLSQGVACEGIIKAAYKVTH